MKFSRVFIVALGLIALWIAFKWLRPETPIDAQAATAGTAASGQPRFWFKGNTHAHAKITLGKYTHGDSSPEEVASWYRDRGYHFLAITDHNRYSTADDVNTPGNTRNSFILIPGMEITSDHRYPGVNTADERKLHSTAFNTDGPTDWHFENPDKAAIIDSHARRVSEGGGVHVLNHPNYRFQVELRDILDAPNVGLMEIANVHPRSNHAGHGGFRPAIEELWDQLLSNGRTIYGVASDDAHDFKWHRVMLRRFGYAPPGGAWVMVRATELDPASIGQALKDGEFYASTGVHLRNVTATDDFYSVELDRERTEAETARAWVRDAAPVVWSTDGHFVIEFIGEWGRVLHSVHDREQARIALDPENRYVRARITYLEKMRGRDRARAFHAWTQPVMISGPNLEEKL